MGRYDVICFKCGNINGDAFEYSRGSCAQSSPTPPKAFISDVNSALAQHAALIGGVSVAANDGLFYWTQAVMYP